jgi:hypothetical protein
MSNSPESLVRLLSTLTPEQIEAMKAVLSVLPGNNPGGTGGSNNYTHDKVNQSAASSSSKRVVEMGS